MGKHAYLIICHNNFEILKKMLVLLDHERNDIYIHVDRKVKNFPYEEISRIVKKSGVFYTKRICVTWGDYSQIQTELLLLGAAVKQSYVYYHLLSGVDFPLKRQEEIFAFFDDNPQREYISFAINDKKMEKHIISILRSWNLSPGCMLL